MIAAIRLYQEPDRLRCGHIVGRYIVKIEERRRSNMAGTKSIAVAVPLAPGKADEGRLFAAEVMGPRRSEHTESRRELAMTKELGWVQATPQGDVFILFLEGKDAVAANQEFAASDSAYNRWFKERLDPIFSPSGVDFSQPIPPIYEQIFEWDSPDLASHSGPTQHFASASPVLPGKMDAFLQGAEYIKAHMSEHEASRKRLGILRERIFAQHTPQGDLQVGYFEAEDIPRVFQNLGSSQEPHDVWFRGFIQDISGIDFSQPLPGPLPELVLDWQDK
jgi:hypothetical protein